METATIEIPLEIKKEFEILAKERGQEFKKFIIDLLLESAEIIEDRELGEKAIKAREEDYIGHEKSLELLNRINNA